MAEISLKPAQFIRLDLFPATVLMIIEELPTSITDQDARVIVTNDMFYVLLEDQPGSAKILFSDYLEEFSGSNREGYAVTTANGSIFIITRANSCGCGNTLRGYFPFPGVPFIKNN